MAALGRVVNAARVIRRTTQAMRRSMSSSAPKVRGKARGRLAGASSTSSSCSIRHPAFGCHGARRQSCWRVAPPPARCWGGRWCSACRPAFQHAPRTWRRGHTHARHSNHCLCVRSCGNFASFSFFFFLSPGLRVFVRAFVSRLFRTPTPSSMASGSRLRTASPPRTRARPRSLRT